MTEKVIEDKIENNSLVAFWKAMDLTKQPFVHPQDIGALEKGNFLPQEQVNFFNYTTSNKWHFDRESIHLSLLPAPYVGDLANATVFILMLNPGFSVSDYYWENKNKEFRKKVLNNIQQDSLDKKFPNFCLDPKFAATGGFIWWERKLRPIAIKLVAERRLSYYEALAVLSKKVAAIELFPYHSTSFPRGMMLNEYGSVVAAKAFVHDHVVPRAKNGEITLIATRAVKAWGLNDVGTSKNIVIYEAGQSRAASLGIESPGGKAILRQMTANPGFSETT